MHSIEMHSIYDKGRNGKRDWDESMESFEITS